MPFATVITAVVAFIVGGVLGCWPLAAWTQHSTKGEPMPLRTVRIAGAAITAVTFGALALRFGLTWILPALLVFRHQRPCSPWSTSPRSVSRMR